MNLEKDKLWVKCQACDWGTEIQFYNPDSVYCEGCDTKIGETDYPVESDLASLVGDEVVHPETGRTLAIVEYDESLTDIRRNG